MKTQVGKEFTILYSKSSKYSKQNAKHCRKCKRCCGLFGIRCKNQSILWAICCATKGSNYSTKERIVAVFILIFTILAVSSLLFNIEQQNVS